MYVKESGFVCSSIGDINEQIQICVASSSTDVKYLDKNGWKTKTDVQVSNYRCAA